MLSALACARTRILGPVQGTNRTAHTDELLAEDVEVEAREIKLFVAFETAHHGDVDEGVDAGGANVGRAAGGEAAYRAAPCPHDVLEGVGVVLRRVQGVKHDARVDLSAGDDRDVEEHDGLKARLGRGADVEVSINPAADAHDGRAPLHLVFENACGVAVFRDG